MHYCLPRPSAFAITRSVLPKPLVAPHNSSGGFSFLSRQCGAQEEIFRNAFNHLQIAITDRVFPACAVAVTLGGELIAHHGLGRFTYESASPAVNADSV